MTPRKGISVLVLTYNHEKYIEECLKSIAAQDYPGPLEIKVFDDASTDGTAHLVRAASEQDPRITLTVRDRNTGAAKNFAEALRACSAPYLAFCEGDDYWIRTDKLSMQAAVLDRSPKTAMVYTDYESGDADGQVLSGRMPGPQPEVFELANLLTDHGPSTLTVMVRRTALNAAFPKVFFEVPNPDVFIFGAVLLTGSAKHITEVTGIHRLHEGGIWSARSATEKKLMRLSTRLAFLSTLLAENRKTYAALEKKLRRAFESAMYAAAYTDTALFKKYSGRLSKGALRKILWSRRLADLKKRIRQATNSREG